MDFKNYYEGQRKLVDNYLQNRIAKKGISRVDEAMAYSLMAGGKRIRPLLLMAAAEAVGSKGYNYLPIACGLEMIHTYSLIHDDLPCMDDDDLRRGRPTNHKVFGEAMAVLAGDGLLTLAFEVMLEQKNCSPEILVETVREIAICAGSFGMVGGQGLDLEAEGKTISPEELRRLHAGKTGALFIAAIRSGARLAGANEQQLLALTRYADLLGLCFQITDDILDVTGSDDELGKPAGSDAKNHKSTYVTLFGLEGAQKLAEDTIAEAMECLESFGAAAENLRRMTAMMCDRKS